MNCSDAPLGRGPVYRGLALWAQISLLVVLALVESAVNSVLVIRLCTGHKRKSPFHRLLKAKSSWGVLLLLCAVPVHVVILVSGGRILSEVTCCIGGTIFQVVLGTMNTMEMLISLERFMKILKPSEHMALFSKVNIRLMLWSTVLMHCMVSLGPAYGWGRYTHSSERLRMWLVPEAFEQSNSSHNVRRSSVLVNYELINQEITSDKLISIFNDSLLSSAEFYAYPTGMQLDLVGRTDVSLNCVRNDYRSGLLSDILFTFFIEKSTAFRQLIGQNLSQLRIEIDNTKAAPDVARDRNYYDSTICEVNYRVTNAGDSFYLLMTSLVQIVLPVVFIVYFNSRLVHRVWISDQRLKVSLLNKDYEHTMESLLGSVVFAALVIPYYGTNFAVRYGHQVSPHVHFAVRVLLYMSASGSTFAHAVAHRQQVTEYWRTKLCQLGWEREVGRIITERTIAEERERMESGEKDNSDETSHTSSTVKRVHSNDAETNVV